MLAIRIIDKELLFIRGKTQPIGFGKVIMNDLVVNMERNTSPGESVDLVIIRDGQEVIIPVTLGERPLP